jgi:hypothetical protein
MGRNSTGGSRRKGKLCAALRSLLQHFGYYRVSDSVPAQAFFQPDNCRLLQASQVFAQALADIGADQWLITGKAEFRRYLAP